MLNDKIISLMSQSVKQKKMEEWLNLSVNCYLYAINCDVSEDKVIYIDENLMIHSGWNVGEISDSFKKNSSKEELRFSFLEDCKILGIEVKKVSQYYNLTTNDEWLVALYYTNSFRYFNMVITDFHFLKKNFGDETWTHKFPHGKILMVDDKKEPITLPSCFSWHVKINDQSIRYKYVDTYCLKKRLS